MSSFPLVRIQKASTPMLYLDTCAMINLARYEVGCCTDTHKESIGKLYDILKSLMAERRIFCAKGNQLEEMGMSGGREQGKDFLYRFENLELNAPFDIEQAELDIGYQAFINNVTQINIDSNLFLKENKCFSLPFTIHVDPVYNREKTQALKTVKDSTPVILNARKTQGEIEKDFESQLNLEKHADFLLFCHIQKNITQDFLNYHGMYLTILDRLGLTLDAPEHERFEAYDAYSQFLLSEHHHLLPYKHIEATLWAHVMQRQNKIKQGDHLDITWAAAYLPFVDFAVTDNDFCELLQSSGLAEQYKTKIYSLRTLDNLLQELEIIR